LLAALDLANGHSIAIPKSAQLLLSPLERAGTDRAERDWPNPSDIGRLDATRVHARQAGRAMGGAIRRDVSV
jgi:hypothetical protein